MTTTPSRAPTADGAATAKAGTARLLAAVAAVLAPVLFAAASLVIPYDTSDSTKEIARTVAAHQGATELSAWFWMVGTLLFVPGLIAVGLLATARSPRLGLWGSMLFGTGMIAVGLTPSLDTVALGAFDKGVSQDAMVKVADGTMGLAVVNAPLFYFIAAHVIGAILLGVALLRGRVIPAWAAWLLILSMPLNVLAYISGVAPLVALSFLMPAIAFAYAGLAFTSHGTGWVRAQ